MATKKATYKLDNGATYDEIMFKTTADQVFFADGTTFQNKLDSGLLKGDIGPTGPQGITGKDGLTTSVTVNGTKYTHSSGNITLPNYPTLSSLGAAATSHTHNYAASSSAGGAANSALVCTGNSATATTLQTARTINGTSFNGSGNITTANWGTARTLTIGNSGKSVNGSENVSWSLSEIGAAATTHVHSQYLPIAGGTITGNLRLKGSGNYGNKLNFGDGEYVYLYEETDDNLTIKAGKLILSSKGVVEGYSTTATGSYSHAEGNATTASADYSHAEGNGTTASGYGSHVEGYFSTTMGYYDHAEGYKTQASGGSSHSEGNLTVASGYYSHAEGCYGAAKGEASHAEGYGSGVDEHIAYGRGSHVEGIDCIAGMSSQSLNTETAAHAEGYKTQAVAAYSHAEGNQTVASATAAHAEGSKTAARGNYSHAEGYGTTTTGSGSHAEGNSTTASGSYSHAEGTSTTASGGSSHAEGNATQASGQYSHAEGHTSISSGHYSHAQNLQCVSQGYSQTAIGRYNVLQGSASSYLSSDAGFIIGNGSDASSRSNSFRVTWGGNVYSKGAYNTSGADYAELFEWYDGNPNNEERLGYFVVIEKGTEKIRKANSNDKDILGIVSNGMAILGDNYDEEWKNKYVRDKWGRIQYETMEICEERDIDGNIITESIIKEVPILNPNYNNQKTYISRKDRKEWSAIGLLGKLLVYNDGTCEIGDYCYPNDEGIATKSDTGYLVIDKHDDLVKILFK